MGATPRLKPNRTPKRIIPHSPHQSGPQRIGDDVSRHPLDVLFPPQRMIVEAFLPNRPGAAGRMISLARAG